MNEQLLQQILEKLNTIENQQKALKQNIDNITINMATKEEVADIPAMKVAMLETNEIVKRIEKQVNIQSDITEKVKDLDTDMRLIKKMLTSQ